MNIDGVSINHKWVASKTEAEFIKEFSGPGYAHLFPEAQDRKAKLKEVYSLCKEKVAADLKAVAPETKTEAEKPA